MGFHLQCEKAHFAVIWLVGVVHESWIGHCVLVCKDWVPVSGSPFGDPFCHFIWRGSWRGLFVFEKSNLEVFRFCFNLLLASKVKHKSFFIVGFLFDDLPQR